MFDYAGQSGNGITVNIGANVEKIPAFLFYPYSNTSTPKITRVDFYDNLKCASIGDFAFTGLENLTSITIPDSVTSIGDYAFYLCISLTSITIPDGVTSIGRSAFYACRSLTSVYYGGTKEQWDNISIGDDNTRLFDACIYYSSYEKGVRAAVLATDSELMSFTVRNKQAFLEGEINGITSGSVNLGVAGAVAKYNGKTENAEGENFFVSLEEIKNGISFTANNFNDYIIPAEAIASYKENAMREISVYMAKNKKDGKTYISTVFARTHNKEEQEFAEVQTQNVDLLNGYTTDVIITAVEKNSPVKEYYLSQDEAHKISDTDGVFSAVDLYSVFDENKTVYAYAMLENGETTEPVSLMLEKKVTSSEAAEFLNSCNSNSVSFLGSDGFKMTISDDIPLLGGAGFSAGLTNLPVGIEIENERIRISIGVDIFENEINGKSDTKWFDFKESCKTINETIDESREKMKEYRALVKKHGLGKAETESEKKKNFDGKVLGYIEAYIIDGEIVFKEVSGTAALELFFNYKQQFLVAGIPAIYAYVKAGGEGSGNLKSGRALADKNIPFEFDAEVSIEPSVKIGGGVGVKDAVSAGVWGKGSLPTNYNFSDKHLTLGLNGEIGLEAEYFMLDANVTLLDGSVNVIDHYFGSSANSISGETDALYSGNAIDVFEEGEITLADRTYLENTSQWLGGQTNLNMRRSITPTTVTVSDLQTSVYKNSQTQLVQFGDTMLMAWIEDDENRDAYNRMRLMYSVYDTTVGVWGEPQAVADNGTCDAAPSLATDGENVYIAWQNIDCTVSAANSETVDAIIQNAEIRLAKYNAETGVFENAITVTDNNSYDYAPKVTVNNGIAEVYWVNSSSLNFDAGTLSILKSDFEGSAETVLSGLNYVHNVDSDGTDVSYAMDADGNTSTTTDVKIYTNGEQVSVDYEGFDVSCLYTTYGVLDSEKTLFYADDYNLCYIQNGEEKTVFDSARGINGNLQICSNGSKTTAMWLEAGELGNELYTCTYENGVWTEPVKLTDFSKVLSNVTVTYFDGKIYGLFNRTNLEEVTSEVDGSTYYKNGATDLCQLTTEGFNNISLSLIEIDEAQFVCGENATFSVLVSNAGTETVSNISFDITDGNGYSQTIEKTVDLASGSSEFIELTYTVPETISKTDLTVYAYIDGDVDEYDNTVSESIGGEDVSIGELNVQYVEGIYIVKGIVTNNNGVSAENVEFATYLGNETDENLYAYNIGDIGPHESRMVEFMIDSSLLNFSEKSYYDVTACVLASEDERVSYNNESETVITQTSGHIHAFGEWIIESEPNCVDEGSEYQECSECGEKVTKSIKATGHTRVVDSAVSSTCTETGLTRGSHCSVCKEILVAQETVAATGHTSVVDSAVPANCTDTGLTQGSHCSVCDEILVVQETVEALGHNAVLDKPIAPTESEFGLTEGYHCSACGLVFKEQESVRPLGYKIKIEDSEVVFAGYDDTLVYEAEGDTVTYQWYATNNYDLTKSVAVRGAASSNFAPMDFYGETNQQAKYKYFYCVANIEINGVKLTAASPKCINAFAFMSETDYSYIDYKNALIYTDSVNNCNSYADIFVIESVTGLNATITPSYQYASVKNYGTGSTLLLEGSGSGKTMFTVIVYGDINADGVIDVLDGAEIAKVSNGHTTFDGIYETAADINGDGVVDVNDYQSAINKALM